MVRGWSADTPAAALSRRVRAHPRISTLDLGRWMPSEPGQTRETGLAWIGQSVSEPIRRR